MLPSGEMTFFFDEPELSADEGAASCSVGVFGAAADKSSAAPASRSSSGVKLTVGRFGAAGAAVGALLPQGAFDTPKNENTRE